MIAMINEKFYEEIKEHLIANINDTFTLNLAISLWEDSKKYKVDCEYYKQTLIDIREYAIKEKEFNDNQINEYKTCIESNINGKFNDEEKENFEHSMSINICINYKMNDILQKIEEVLGDEK